MAFPTRQSNSRKMLSVDKHNVPYHECNIKTVSDSCLPKLPPQSGRIPRFFRKCRKILIVTDENPDSQQILRSHAAITSERKRHHAAKWYVLHPFSKLNTWRELVVTITWSVVFVKDPFGLAFLPFFGKFANPFYTAFIVITDFVLLLYLITCFFTGKLKN